MSVLSCHCLATSSNITCIFVSIACSHTSDFLPTNAMQMANEYFLRTQIFYRQYLRSCGSQDVTAGQVGADGDRLSDVRGRRGHLRICYLLLELAMNFPEDFKTTDRAFSQLKLLKAPSYFTLKNYLC